MPQLSTGNDKYTTIIFSCSVEMHLIFQITSRGENSQLLTVPSGERVKLIFENSKPDRTKTTVQ